MQKLSYFLFLISLICPHNYIYGMEKDNTSKSNVSISLEPSDFEALELSDFRYVPKEVIEEIAARSRIKNALMQVSKLFSKVCSFNNLLKCRSLILHPSDGQYFINRYVREDNIDMVKNLLDKGAPCPYGLDVCNMSKEMYDLLETYGMTYKVIDLLDESIQKIAAYCGPHEKNMLMEINKRFNRLFSNRSIKSHPIFFHCAMRNYGDNFYLYGSNGIKGSNTDWSFVYNELLQITERDGNREMVEFLNDQLKK